MNAALVGGSTFVVEHQKYAAHAAAPYCLSHFQRRYTDWQAAYKGHGPPLEPVDASAGSSPGPKRKRLAFTAAYAFPEEGRALEQGLLFISEPNVALQIRLGALCIRDHDGGERTFPRGRHRVQSIILASPGASVTIEAMRFAMANGSQSLSCTARAKRWPF